MDSPYAIFPARCEWPNALSDVTSAPEDAVKIRLISGATKIGALKSLKNLKHLWCFGIADRELEKICECSSLETLYIESIKSESLSLLKNLTNLKILSLESYSKATTFEFLSELHWLHGLAITNFKNVHELDPLSKIKKLQALGVSGSMWTAMQVETLKPIAHLEHLELLHLTNIKVKDESLKSLSGLKNLKNLDIANFYPTSEFAILSQQLKNTECGWFEPYHEVTYQNCEKCSSPLVMLTGKRKPTICKICKSSIFQKHINEWHHAQKAA